LQKLPKHFIPAICAFDPWSKCNVIIILLLIIVAEVEEIPVYTVEPELAFAAVEYLYGIIADSSTPEEALLLIPAKTAGRGKT